MSLAAEQTQAIPKSPTSNGKPFSQPDLDLKPLNQQPSASATNQSQELSISDNIHEPAPAPRTPKSAKGWGSSAEGDESAWGSNFWVTLVDPQTQTSFFACPATGQVSWDPPAGNFVLPPSAEGEWWELSDESRGGLPYYYHTKTSETVWERPDGFVIPLGILQDTALGRRLSQTTFSRFSQNMEAASTPAKSPTQTSVDRPSYRRSKSYANGQDSSHDPIHHSRSAPSRSSLAGSSPTSNQKNPPVRRSVSNEHTQLNGSRHLHPFSLAPQLPTIPASPYATEGSSPPSPSSRRSVTLNTRQSKSSLKGKEKDSSNGVASPSSPKGKSRSPEPITRARSKSSSYVPHKSPPPQSLNAAAEILVGSHSDSGHGPAINISPPGKQNNGLSPSPTTPTKRSGRMPAPPSPRRPIPAVPGSNGLWPGKSVAGKIISSPMPNPEATLGMSPVKNRAAGKPIPVEPVIRSEPYLISAKTPNSTLVSRVYPALPHDLASAIQQFSESDYAKQYFSTHRTGFIFRRRVPVAQMMVWQKAPLNSPLLTLQKALSKDAVKIFKVIQHIMGDRERERAVGVRLSPDNHISTVASLNASTTSLPASAVGLLEEERWLLGEGLGHGEMRDEIYCQLMKQLMGNPNPESVFKGWQLMCVLLITFPPSKNFETYLCSFIQQRTTQQQGRVDVMAKYCLRRLTAIAKKGPRGKPPTIAEIEIASDAAFNPSTFGESLDAIVRLQERNYAHLKVPIILPFLADGILALGGPKSEGIFRVPGDGDSVSELKLRIDRGYYTLDGVDDPHVLASLMKLWLRELCDPLIPEEMYNECITSSKDPEACVRIVERLPTINRRVVLFVVSFLQLFLDDRIQSVTKMTPANLALVMAPNLLRCNSESMAVVFTNAQYEQIYVYNLLLHLKCDEIDPDYVPVHGLGAVPSTPAPRASKSRSRRQQ
ncbi:hypothetical protein HGRIS_002360 [Hohenbuehelia grisea]|uniref:Rho GTPase-activating protein 39 n=1 Tax=Hohenbuehelia grisea TaxID=104357 RepID=A0ABR3JLD5_9AGAR